jgi:cytoskeleton protein RodZ
MANNQPARGGTRHRLPHRFGRSVEREPAPSFGEALAQARRTRGLSLEDVERETRIPLKYLAALEEQEYGVLPGGVYARGVLRGYATHLGLDPEPLLEQFRPARPREERTPVRPMLQPTPEGPGLSWPLLLVVLAGIGVALLGTYLHGQYVALSESLDVPERPAGRGLLDVPEPLVAPWTPLPRITPTPFLVVAAPPPEEPPPEPPAEAPEPPPAATPGAVAVAPPTATAVPTPPPPPTTTPTPRPAVVVEARVLERSWLQVWADGNQVFADTVPGGNTRTFTANDLLQMRVGNAGGVQVAVNGEPQGRLGASGQAVDVAWGRR